jgi:hypothetical protein
MSSQSFFLVKRVLFSKLIMYGDLYLLKGPYKYRTQDRSAGVNGVQADPPRNRISIPPGAIDFSFLQTFYPMCPGGSFLGGKAAGTRS